MKPPGATTNTTTVREFMHIIAAQAKAALAAKAEAIANATAAEPDKAQAPLPVSFLQLSRLHPSDDDGTGDANPVPSRFMLDDVERMIAAAVADSENGHNVYVEGRTVREGLQGRKRGGFEDTVAVFAYTVDGDADKGMGWTPTVPVSMTVETSPGNFHHWLFLKEAITDWGRAKELGDRIRAAVGADHDTGTITQPYRVAGTVNYPGCKKIERGRVTVPTRIVEFDLEALWTQEDIEQAFPAAEQKTDGGTASAGSADEATIPDDTLREIRGPVPKQNRGNAFWNVVRTLKEDGWTLDGIVTLLEKYPDGCAGKYRGRLRREVGRVFDKIKIDGTTAQQSARVQPETFCAEALKPMTFAPLKYVVPEIIVEGLTLFAGKPKMGKSWLLLHAAVAVARGGFTLGELHCIEGDVLYCALEDNQRRLQARLKKMIGFSPAWPARLFFYCELPRLAEGGLEAIRAWLKSKPHPRLVIIDTLAMVRAPKKRDESTYDADYAAVLELRALANEFGVAIVLVHHLRKADADDAFDTVSGTLGLTGAPDTVLILKRDSSGTIVLHGKGRDLVEIEKAMTFDSVTCTWTVTGNAADVRRSHERTTVLKAIEEAGEPIGPNDIAAATGMKAGNIRRLLGKLLKEGAVEKAAYGRYRLSRKAA
jgi:AAA domain/RepB DNA-primase from phage plasmid/IclR helix-turn-helix domain